MTMTFGEYVKFREQTTSMQPGAAPPNKPKTPQEVQKDRQVKAALKTTVASTGKPPGSMKPLDVMNKADPNLDPEQLAQLTKIAAGAK